MICFPLVVSILVFVDDPFDVLGGGLDEVSVCEVATVGFVVLCGYASATLYLCDVIPDEGLLCAGVDGIASLGLRVRFWLYQSDGTLRIHLQARIQALGYRL